MSRMLRSQDLSKLDFTQSERRLVKPEHCDSHAFGTPCGGAEGPVKLRGESRVLSRMCDNGDGKAAADTVMAEVIAMTGVSRTAAHYVRRYVRRIMNGVSCMNKCSRSARPVYMHDGRTRPEAHCTHALQFCTQPRSLGSCD